ncbi:MAG: S1 RNA-binding domain-containing protein [Oscillospiraceae bacterium]|nr:S1 RNA-binding domain-containing protein [Oscillospiraceae bacterium]
MTKYYPEGVIYETKQNKRNISSVPALRESFFEGRILEAKVRLCDGEHNLHVDLGSIKGIIPRTECALGIAEGTTKDIAIVSRVNKPVVFKITDFFDDEDGNRTAVLSRRAVQEECVRDYISNLTSGDIIPAKVTHNEHFGSFCDIGCGISALLPIDGISVSRIPSPETRFSVNSQINAVVKSIDENGRVTLSLKELLGTWEENAEQFSAGQTVGGIVRSVEKYGVFIELAPNLAGLAEYSEDVRVGDAASVYIKSVNPQKMKIKLAIVDTFPAEHKQTPLKYYFDGAHIDYWRYSPDSSEKVIESIF